MPFEKTQHTFWKDLQNLYKKLNDSTDGQATIMEVNGMSIRVRLQPKSGINAHAEFLLTIICDETFPQKCPELIFHTPIFHPNIDISSGWICCSIIYDWHSCYSLLDVIKAVLYLIEHPNFDSPNNTYGELKNPSLLPEKTTRLLAGLPVKGRQFAPNLSWCQWARANDCLPTCEEEEVEDKEVVDEEKKEAMVEGRNDEEVKDKAPCISKDLEYLYDDGNLENKKSTNEVWDESFYTQSETIPSFANARYSIDLNEEHVSVGRYMTYKIRTHESHRIVIWHPDHPGSRSSYFFIELCGSSTHKNELGEFQYTLFSGSFSREGQIQPDARQTSSSYRLYDFSENSRTISYNSFPRRVSVINLESLFAVPASPYRSLTRDFCPWSSLDGKGAKYLLGGMFYERPDNATDFRCFLDIDDDVCGSSEGIGRLFNSSNGSELADTEVQSMEESLSEDELLNAQEGSSTHSQMVPPIPSVASLTYSKEDYDFSSFQTCRNCLYDLDYARDIININLNNNWKWIFRQTRWSIRFAPQQKVNISMQDIRIPPWRGSTARLMSDICEICEENTKANIIALLDPMTLSPLSPILNLMRRYDLTKSSLTGVLWMTPLEALSPFYRVPIPASNSVHSRRSSSVQLPNPVNTHEDGKYEEEGEENRNDWEEEEREGAVNYPPPIYLRYLALMAFLTNWVSWMSRMEVYSSLGQSRYRSIFLSDSVAAHLLQPHSLGCGGAPLLDLWPLWLLRRLLASSHRLAHFCFFQPSYYNFQFLFPFSDLDEI